MNLYLVRHGIAHGKDVDPRRSLTDTGREETARLAGFLREYNVSVTRVAHSDKLRARQTAEILAPAVLPDGAPEQAAGLHPTDPVDSWVHEVGAWSDDLMLVGHLPFVGKLAAALITGNEHADVVVFDAGAVACLERGGDSSWRLAWMVTPATLPEPG